MNPTEQSFGEAKSHSVRKFSALYGTWRFITVFTRLATCPYPRTDVVMNLWSSSLCSPLQHHASSSFVGPNIILY